jgi:hypothetical protein
LTISNAKRSDHSRRLVPPEGEIAAVFIATSIYFAFIPISTRFGQIVAHAYCIVGIGLIVVLFASLRLEFNDQRSDAS